MINSSKTVCSALKNTKNYLSYKLDQRGKFEKCEEKKPVI